MGWELSLSGPICANRFAIRVRIASILCESILASQKSLHVLLIGLPDNGIAARTGRKLREFQCESERRRDSRESGPSASIRNWSFFLRIDSRESIRTNLRNVGV